METIEEQLEQANIEYNQLKDMINDLLWDWDNGHLNPFELVKQIKELTE